MFGSSGFFVGLEFDAFYRPPAPRQFYTTVLEGISLFPEGFMGDRVVMSSNGSLALAAGARVDRITDSSGPIRTNVGDVLNISNDIIINGGPGLPEMSKVAVANNAPTLGGLGENYSMGQGLAINSSATEIYISIPGYNSSLGAILYSMVPQPYFGLLNIAQGNIVCPDNIVGDNFGRNLVINNNDNILAVQGGFNFTTRRGAVYMFSRSNTNDPTSWVFNQKIDIGAVNNADFGRSIAVISSPDNSDHHLIVGAPGFNSNRGALYFYRSNSINGPWTANGSSSTTGISSFNGSAVVANYEKGKIVSGSPGASSNIGTIQVFNIVNGTPAIQESISGIFSGGSFGSSLALSGDGNVLYIGQPNFNRGVIRQRYLSDTPGAAFNRYTTDNLNSGFGNSSNVSSSARFGTSIATNFTGDRFIAGAPGNTLSTSPLNRAGYIQLNYV